MQFKRHKELEGFHAPYSPSQSSWLRYDDKKIASVHKKKKAALMGTRLHAWAKETIDLGIKQPDTGTTLSAYVNDAIGFKMTTEVVQYYSDRVFGTADAICYRKNADGRYVLRIHDLKTGEEKASMEQLEVYAALFCLEYKVRPGDIDMELRIYQSNQVFYHNPTAEDIAPIMDKIVHLDKITEKIDLGED